MLVYTTQSLNKPVFAEQKRKMAPQAKKIRGTVRSEQKNFMVPSFQSSGGRARGPQKCPKIPSFFFFFSLPKKDLVDVN